MPVIVICKNIKWKHDEGIAPPKNVKVEFPDEDVKGMTEEEISIDAGVKLSDDYGFCHSGFDYKIKRTK